MDKVREQTAAEGAMPGHSGDTVVVLERPRTDAHRPQAEAPAAPAVRQGSDAPPATEAKAPKPPSKIRKVLPVLLLAAIGGVGWYGYGWWTNGRFMVSTDDAYVQGDVATLGTKLAGYVASVPVKDGDRVKAGDLLVKIDDTDYRLALVSAEARRATQTATIARIDQQITAQAAQIESAKANIQSAEAGVRRAQSAFDRAQVLTQQNFSSKATLDQSVADRDQTAAALSGAKAAETAAEAQIGVLKAQKVEAEQTARELDAAVTKARSDLTATEVRAPSDGIIGNRAAQPGQYVSPGSRLMALVPMGSVYVAANFKETQLAALRPGQKVELEVDSVAGRHFEGTVVSLSPASGSTFSLLPPENATGNFTKITQRVPVRIEVPAEIRAEGVLRPGLSVTAAVDTRTTPSSAH